MDENKHLDYLEDLCRLCRMKAASIKGYKVVKFATEFSGQIQSLFGYDLNNDIDGVHPKKLCSSCVRKLRYINVKTPLHEKQEIAKFAVHKEDCPLCTKKMTEYKFKAIPLKCITIASIIKMAKEFGLTELETRSTTSSCTILRVKYDDKNRPDTQQTSQLNNLNPSYIDITIDVKADPAGGFLFQTFVYEKAKSFDDILPTKLSSQEDAEKLFSYISNAKVCEGNIDTDLPKLTTKRKEDINDSKTSTRLETPELKQFNKVRTTIRNQNCTLLTHNEKRCNECQKSRHDLQKMERRQSIEAKAKKPHASMTKAELTDKLTNKIKENKELKRKQKKLEKRIEKLVKKEGVVLHEEDNEPLVRAIVRKEECPFEKGSAMALLWQQQKTASHFKKSTSMRWHPVIIRWALSIYLRSSGNYCLFMFTTHSYKNEHLAQK